MEQVREIFREYAATLDVDLSFQDFDEELATLPGEYAAPRGQILLAHVDGNLAGCCALRPQDSVDYTNAAEMKRLYVRKAFRGFGLGRLLAEGTLDAARLCGYACVLLDTLDGMESARALYADLGFEEIRTITIRSRARTTSRSISIDPRPCASALTGSSPASVRVRSSHRRAHAPGPRVRRAPATPRTRRTAGSGRSRSMP